MVGNFTLLFAALFTVLERNNVNPGYAGLSLSYAMAITQVRSLLQFQSLSLIFEYHGHLLTYVQSLNWLVRSATQLETDIVAVERVSEYTQVWSVWSVCLRVNRCWLCSLDFPFFFVSSSLRAKRI